MPDRRQYCFFLLRSTYIHLKNNMIFRFFTRPLFLLALTILFGNVGQSHKVAAQAHTYPHVPFHKSEFKGAERMLKRYKWEIRKADGLIAIDRNYREGIRTYLKANKFNPFNGDLHFKIGKAYLQAPDRDVLRAIDHLEKATLIDPLQTPEIYFYLGRAYHLGHYFTKALACYEHYVELFKGKERTEARQKVRKHVEACKFAIENYEEQWEVKFSNLGRLVNSEYAEHGPVVNVTEEVLFFTSRRSDNMNYDPDYRDWQYYEDIFYSTRVGKGTWRTARKLERHINSKGHDAVVGISSSGKTLFVYQGKNGGDILICRLDKRGAYGPPEKFPADINSPYTESSASVSPDGNTVYFVSNRPNGSKGGFDIFYCEKDAKGKWSQPKNIGSVINTSGNETAVWAHPDGKTLYFSSDGHDTFGGADIFRSVLQDKGRWSKPEQLGFPLNSAGDDFIGSVSADHKRFYLSLSRPGGMGHADIYVAEWTGAKIKKALTPDTLYVVNSMEEELPEVFVMADTLMAEGIAAAPVKEITRPVSPNEPVVLLFEQKTVAFTFLLKDALSGAPVRGQLSIEGLPDSGVLLEKSITGQLTDSVALAERYRITVSAPGYHPSERLTNAAGLSQLTEILLNAIEKDRSLVLEDLLFDLNRSELKDDFVPVLDRLVAHLSQNPDIQVQIEGHADNTGNTALNKRLSRLRAQAVSDYLLKNGIPAQKISIEAFGDSQPIADNETEEGRSRNRRVEVKLRSNKK